MSIPTFAEPAVHARTEVPLLSLLIALTADYPDLDRHTIARAVEVAAATAEVLSPGLGYAPRHVEMLARDRLDATAGRMAMHRRNTRSTDCRPGENPSDDNAPRWGLELL